jgi:hypothetical protein
MGRQAGFGFSGLYPVLLAIHVNGGPTAMYKSALLPEEKTTLNYWIKIFKPFFFFSW